MKSLSSLDTPLFTNKTSPIPGFDTLDIKFIIEKLKIDEKLIEKALMHFNEASRILMKVDNFSYTQKELLHYFFPLMIKESSLKHSARSSSWAFGYFQLTHKAIVEAKKHIKNNLKIDQTFSKWSPSEHIVLWIVYYLYVLPKELTSTLEKTIHPKDKLKFTYAQYNAGTWTIRWLLKKYIRETKQKNNITRDQFCAWLAWKTPGLNGQYTMEQDTVYKVKYKNRFGKQSSIIKKSTWKIFADLSIRYKKAHEMIEYAEKIIALQKIFNNNIHTVDRTIEKDPQAKKKNNPQNPQQITTKKQLDQLYPNDNAVLLPMPSTPDLQVNQSQKIDFPPYVKGAHTKYLEWDPETNHHHDIWYAYKVDTYFFQDTISTETAKKYFIDTIHEWIKLKWLVLVDMYGFEYKDPSYKEHKQWDIIYFAKL